MHFASMENDQTYFGITVFAKVLALFQMLWLTKQIVKEIFLSL